MVPVNNLVLETGIYRSLWNSKVSGEAALALVLDTSANIYMYQIITIHATHFTSHAMMQHNCVARMVIVLVLPQFSGKAQFHGRNAV